MRMLRPLLLAGTALLALAPTAARAQAANRFVDSWFVGAKGGVMTFWTSRVKHAPAPLAGIETMITRKRAALYLAADMSFFKEPSSYQALGVQYPGTDSAFTYIAGDAEVQLKNMRRYSAALLAFPKDFGTLRPYLGVGLSVNNIITVGQTGGVVGPPADGTVEERQSTSAAMFLVGAQGQVGRVAVFGQGTFNPAQSRFLIGGRSIFYVEGGVRLNIGSSREKVE